LIIQNNMNSFKDIAYQILKEAGKPLHSKEITKIALDRGWLKTAGKTPEATMNAQLVVDINSKKEKSRFIKTGPSIFGLNENFVAVPPVEVKKAEKIYKIFCGVASVSERRWGGASKFAVRIFVKKSSDFVQ
jgi:Protein of unknown function (DUF511).